MDPLDAKLIRDAMSAERLSPYLAACSADLTNALRLYAWNLEISGAFHWSLSSLEVVTRNALHDQLSALVGRYDWWDSPRVPLQQREFDKILIARRQIPAHRQPATPGRIVAELSFGFWVALLRREYEVSLWRPALHRVFPGYRGPRTYLHENLRHMVILRNRIAHHEPIHRRRLTEDHKTIRQLISFVSPETATWVLRQDPVPAVLNRRVRP